MLDNADAKTQIAQAAVSLFEEAETLFIDTGSTTLYLAEQLSEVSGLTVVTNSAEIARTVSSSARRSIKPTIGSFCSVGSSAQTIDRQLEQWSRPKSDRFVPTMQC